MSLTAAAGIEPAENPMPGRGRNVSEDALHDVDVTRHAPLGWYRQQGGVRLRDGFILPELLDDEIGFRSGAAATHGTDVGIEKTPAVLLLRIASETRAVEIVYQGKGAAVAFRQHGGSAAPPRREMRNLIGWIERRGGASLWKPPALPAPGCTAVRACLVTPRHEPLAK